MINIIFWCERKKTNMYKYSVNFELIKCMHNLLWIQNYFKIILLINAGCWYLMKMYSTFGSLFEIVFLVAYSDAIMTKCFSFILLRISFFFNNILMISLYYICHLPLCWQVLSFSYYINFCIQFYPCDIVINRVICYIYKLKENGCNRICEMLCTCIYVVFKIYKYLRYKLLGERIGSQFNC